MSHSDSVRSHSAVSIRPYVLADWPRVCDIHDRARLDELRLSGHSTAFRSLARSAHSQGLFDGQLDVGLLDGVVQGFVAYQRHALNWLYVHPDGYRRGVGRSLLRHALADCGPVVGTQALQGNEPALRLYRSEGFVEIERRPGLLAGSDDYPSIGVILRRWR